MFELRPSTLLLRYFLNKIIQELKFCHLVQDLTLPISDFTVKASFHHASISRCVRK